MIIRNTFIAKTLRGCNGPAVRIKGNKRWGKNMIKNKTTKKKKKKKDNFTKKN